MDECVHNFNMYLSTKLSLEEESRLKTEEQSIQVIEHLSQAIQQATQDKSKISTVGSPQRLRGSPSPVKTRGSRTAFSQATDEAASNH